MFIKLTLLTITVWTVLLQGCSTATNSRIGGRDGKPVERWSNFEQHDFSAPVSDSRYGRVIFARAKNNSEREAINIYVNGEYLASLLPKGAASVQLCRGRNKLLASYTSIKTRYLDKADKGQFYSIPAAKVSYFQIEESLRGTPVFRQITAETFKSLDIDKQRHTLSRVDKKQSCLKQTNKISPIKKSHTTPKQYKQ